MAPSSSPSPSSSKKLRITDPNPRSKPDSAPPAAPSNSAASSTTTAMSLPRKRTRDKPNLVDCHCCGRRQNNSKERLQPLDSVWRIVLLCRKCSDNIQSGQACPYCFQETRNSEDLCQCRVCERKIHKDCGRGYGDCRPWCYLEEGMDGFGVCVDCWVPELLKNSVRVCSRSKKKGGLKGRAEAKHLLEKAVNDVECDVKRVNAGGNAKAQALKRNKLTVDFASDALDWLSKNDKDGAKAENSSSVAIAVAGDAELPSQLVQAINCSPTILRSKCLVNSSSLDVLNIRRWKGFTYKRFGIGKSHGEGQKLGCADHTNKERMNQPRDNGQNNGANVSNLGLIPYKRDRNRKMWQLNNDNAVVSETSQQKTELNLHLDDAMTRDPLKSSANTSDGSIDVNADQINLSANVDRFGQELVSYRRTRLKQKVCLVNGSIDVNGPCNDVNGLILGLLPYKQDRMRKICQLDDENTMVYEDGQQKVKFNFHPDDSNASGPMKRCADVLEGLIDVSADQSNPFTNVGRFGEELVSYKRTRFRQKLCQINGSTDISEGRVDVNGSNQGLLPYKRDRKRKIWQLNDQNTVVSEACQSNVKCNLHLDDARTWGPMKRGADVLEVLIDVNADQSNPCTNVGRFGEELVSYKRTRFRQKACQMNDSTDTSDSRDDVNGPNNDFNGSNLGLLPYKRDRKRKIWQLNDENTVVSEASQQTGKIQLTLMMQGAP